VAWSRLKTREVGTVTGRQDRFDSIPAKHPDDRIRLLLSKPAGWHAATPWVRGSHGGQESSSFLKKRTKKLLFMWAEPIRKSRSKNSQKFFASFFQKEDFSVALNFGCPRNQGKLPRRATNFLAKERPLRDLLSH
jgi:hypothetical protein